MSEDLDVITTGRLLSFTATGATFPGPDPERLTITALTFTARLTAAGAQPGTPAG